MLAASGLSRSSVAQVTVTLMTMPVSPGDPVVVAVSVSTLDGLGVSGYQMRMMYDPSVVVFGSASFDGTLSQGMLAASNMAEPGDIRVAAAAASEMAGEGVLLFLNGEAVAVGTTPLIWADFQFDRPEIIAMISDSSISVVSGVDVDGSIFQPERTSLGGNYPNPFNRVTSIRFETPETMRVRLVVYDAAGSEVARLLDDVVGSGEHEVRFAADGLRSGLFIYRIEAGARVLTGQAILIR